MRKLQFMNNGVNWIQVSKRTAKKLYLQGFDVVLSPCNLYPFGAWGIGYTLNRKSREGFCIDEIGVEKDFDSYINSYEYYNCTNNETGRYTAFYVAEVHGLHLTFLDGSNPWIIYGNMDTVQKSLRKWGKNYTVSGLRVSGGGIVSAMVQEKRREAFV